MSGSRTRPHRLYELHANHTQLCCHGVGCRRSGGRQQHAQRIHHACLHLQQQPPHRFSGSFPFWRPNPATAPTSWAVPVIHHDDLCLTLVAVNQPCCSAEAIHNDFISHAKRPVRPDQARARAFR